MGLPAFDTHAFVKRLKLAGFNDSQAEAQAELQSEVLSSLIAEKLATKEDIKHLEDKITALGIETKQDIAALATETKQDIAALAAETKQDIAALAAETKQDIAGLTAIMNQEFIRQDAKIAKLDVKFNGKFNQLYWMIAFLLATNMTILLKIFHV